MEETEKMAKRGGSRIEEEKQRQVIELYRQGLSPRKVAKELGTSRWHVGKILTRNNEPRRNISEAKTKYPKTDFSGDPAELARIYGFAEDCGVCYNYKQILVQTSTTHYSQIILFNDTFGRYGHVNMTPFYNSKLSIYQWQLTVYLNPSFEFLIEYKRNPLKSLTVQINDSDYVYIYIGSLTDAEGCVGIYDYKGYVRVVCEITNDNRELLEWAKRRLGGNIVPNGNGNNLQLYGEEAIEALRILPIRHQEKAAAKQLILHHANNGRIVMQALSDYQALRRRIRQEVQLCTLQARLEYIRRHRKPHPKDPDQTIPPN